MLQKGNMGDLFVEKKVDNFIVMCSLLLWSNCPFSAVGDSEYSVALGTCP